MLISQTFKDSSQDESYALLQKWYTLTNDQRHEVIKELADNLNKGLTGVDIKQKLKDAINKAKP